MIIDSHTHIGNSFWGNFSPEFLLDIIGDSVDLAICSNLEGIDCFTGKDEIECNLAMLNIAKYYPQIKALAVCEVDRTENGDKIRQLLSEHPEFIGLKFHPEFTKLAADSEKYDDYLKLENIILAPDKIIQDRKNNLRMFKCINGKFYEIVIKTTKNKNENYLTTFHRCNISKLRDKKR